MSECLPQTPPPLTTQENRELPQNAPSTTTPERTEYNAATNNITGDNAANNTDTNTVDELLEVGLCGVDKLLPTKGEQELELEPLELEPRGNGNASNLRLNQQTNGLVMELDYGAGVHPRLDQHTNGSVVNLEPEPQTGFEQAQPQPKPDIALDLQPRLDIQTNEFVQPRLNQQTKGKGLNWLTSLSKARSESCSALDINLDTKGRELPRGGRKGTRLGGGKVRPKSSSNSSEADGSIKSRQLSVKDMLRQMSGRAQLSPSNVIESSSRPSPSPD